MPAATTTPRITIVGATTGPGKSLFVRLAEDGFPVLGIGRNLTRVQQLTTLTASTGASVIACDVSINQDFLGDTDILVLCSRPALAPLLMPDSLQRFIALGSTRKFTRFPDERCRDVLVMEQLASESMVPTTILHPTLIYGGDGLNNVERIIAAARRYPLIPLPAGGRTLIQPIHCDDVATALYQCITDDCLLTNQSIVIAGPSPLTYREFVAIVLDAMAIRTPIVSMPYPLIATAALVTGSIPGLPAIGLAEVRRLLEDKHFDVLDMTRLLALTPRDFATGMRDHAARLAGSVTGT